MQDDARFSALSSVTLFREDRAEREADLLHSRLLHLRRILPSSLCSWLLPLEILWGRAFLLADVYFDVNVALDYLAEAELRQCGYISFGIIALTYCVMVAVLGPVVVSSLQQSFCRLAPTTFLHVLGTVLLSITWIACGPFIILALDLYLFARYCVSLPLEVRTFHYMKLRGLAEVIEACLETCLTGYVYLRVCNPYAAFRPLETQHISIWKLATSLLFSMRNIHQQWLFFTKFAAIQSESRWKFLQDMCHLGGAMAPSSLYEAAEISTELNCHFELENVSFAELMALSRSFRLSPKLQRICFCKTGFLKVLRQTPGGLESWLNRIMQSKVRTLSFTQEVPADVYECLANQACSTWRTGSAMEVIEIRDCQPIRKPTADLHSLRSMVEHGRWQQVKSYLQLVLWLQGALREPSFDNSVLASAAEHPANVHCLELLLLARACPNAAFGSEERPLVHWAAKDNSLPNLQVLTKSQADIHRKCRDGRDALFRAASGAAPDCLAELIRARAQVNVADGGGITALMVAAYVNSLPCVKALLDAEADVQTKSANGQTALMLAAASGATSCVRAILTTRRVPLDAWVTCSNF